MVTEKKTTDLEAPPKVSIEEAWARLQEEWRQREAEDRALLDDLRERHRIVPSAPVPVKKA